MSAIELSDSRFKDNIEPLTNCGLIMENIEAIRYTLPYSNDPNKIHYGIRGDSIINGLDSRTIPDTLQNSINYTEGFVHNIKTLFNCPFSDQTNEILKIYIENTDIYDLLQINTTVLVNYGTFNISGVIVERGFDGVQNKNYVNIYVRKTDNIQSESIYLIGTMVNDIINVDYGYMYAINFATTKEHITKISNLETNVSDIYTTFDNLTSNLVTNELTAINGTITNLTSTNGNIDNLTSNNGVSFGNLQGIESTSPLNFFKTEAINLTFYQNGHTDNTGTVTALLQRVGNFVSLFLPEFTITTTNDTGIIDTVDTINAIYRPSTNQNNVPRYVLNNGNNVFSNYKINTDGSIKIYMLVADNFEFGNNTNFTSYAQTLCWTIDQ